MRYDKKLIVELDNNEERKITLYDDPNEVAYPRVVLRQMDGTRLYARFTDLQDIYASLLEVDIDDEDYPKRIIEKMTHTVHIVQEPRETITVTADGVDHTEDFTIDHSARYEVKVEAITGWDPGIVHPVTSGIATDDMTFTVEDAYRETYAIHVPQVRGQQIVVYLTDKDVAYMSDFTAEFEDRYHAILNTEYGFIPGEIQNPEGIFTGETTIVATPPTKDTFTVHITQSANQTITVRCNGVDYTSDFTAEYESPYTVTVTGAYGYDPGAPAKTSDSPLESTSSNTGASGKVLGNMTFSAAAATLKRYTITITQSAHETITVKYNGSNYTSSFTAIHGYSYTASVAGATGYNPGRLSSTSGTFTGPMTFTVTAASLKTYTVSISQSSNQTITVKYNGSNYTKSFTATHGYTYTASIAASSGWTAGTLSSTSGTITKAITISATAAKRAYATAAYTTAGSFTFTVPSGVSRLRVTIIGGGGGSSVLNRYNASNGNHAGGTGGTSYFTVGSTKYTSSGGGGGNVVASVSYDSEGYSYYTLTPKAGTAGSPSGRAGKAGQTTSNTVSSAAGGAGYALGQGSTMGGGGSVSSIPRWTGYATGGGGGYRRFTVNVSAGSKYSGYVGAGGARYLGGNAGTSNAGVRGGIFIEYGGSI